MPPGRLPLQALGSVPGVRAALLVWVAAVTAAVFLVTAIALPRARAARLPELLRSE